MSTSMPTLAEEFGIDMGIIPSSTMLPAPVQHLSVPFVSARARIAEFERLREQIRRTDIVREMQVERLHALACEPPYEFNRPQFCGSTISAASVPIHSSMTTTPRVAEVGDEYYHYRPQLLPHVPVTGVASPGPVPRGRVSQACEHCKFRKVKCSGGTPCERCAERAVGCVYGRKKVRGPTKKRMEMRDTPVRQVPSSSVTPPPMLDDTSTFVPTHTPISVPTPARSRPRPPMSLSAGPTLLSAVPSLSRPLFSPPTPAAPTLATAPGEVFRPTASTSPRNEGTQASPAPLQSNHSSLIPSSSSSLDSAVRPTRSASPERFSDEEIMASFKMPIDPSGTPSGFFDFLDPSQEVPLSDEPGVRSGRSPNLDFIVSFEADSDSSFEVLGEEVPIEEARKDVPAPPVVKPSVLVAPSALKRAPSMPTIIEEDEGEEEDGDLTVTPNAAQRALLPPDRFARPHSSSQVACAAAVPENAGDDSLDTPRPRAQESAFSVPAPDPFDASSSFDARLKGFQESQGDSFCQFDFYFSTIADSDFANFGFDPSFDVDISAWNEAVFGEFPSQESTASSSPSFWELESREAPSVGTSVDVGTDTHTDMQLQFPSVNTGAIGNGSNLPTDDDFLRAIMEAVQSTPKRAHPQDGFEFFSEGDFYM